MDIFNIIFAQNIDCGYMLEPPRRAVLTSTHNLCLHQKVLLHKNGVQGGIRCKDIFSY